ncbi:hypothetical protein ABZ342_11445 [Amycolatopsis sp. NPDC005961]|uniref:hypothetical protein n=1 Tax=Amycolatopsis sp. NPDC005961 TaxID=3156720 RepID=UPI0033DF2533
MTTKLYHQGGWVCSAAPAALPLLTDLVSDRAVHHRREVVELIRLLAGEAVTAAEKWVAPGWQRALDGARPRLLALLDDADPRVRRETTVLAAGIAALRYLADIGVVDGRVRAVAQAIADNPRRIACNGGWRTFSEDEQIRAAASALVD